MIQVAESWLDDPIPIPSSGLIPGIRPEGVSTAFRFGVEQADKLRAFDDPIHNWANIACAVWTPITLPTWDHIAQSALDIRKRRLDWGFPKKIAHQPTKIPPLRPGRAHLAFVALQSPAEVQRYASHLEPSFWAILQQCYIITSSRAF